MTIHQTIGRWFNVHEDELNLFVWTVALLFLLRSAGILLNNYAETAFLKRYGVEYMPIVNMANAVATLFVMGAMTGLMTRFSSARLLAHLFVFCAASVAAIRGLIPIGIDWVYPILFMLKAQYEVLLALLFWNLANDLFNTRQSKRLFPLITAGGVIGQILGSFATPWAARWMHLDNLLLVYAATSMAGAWAMLAMGRRYPTLLVHQKPTGGKKHRDSMIEEFKSVLPMMKASILLKILVVLTFVPNVVIPIMNYQFNFAVNDHFATESGLLQFFGYFRAVLNSISLVILLFVGKLYGRFGLPVALMFHPFNYVLVFLAFLLRFDVVAAVYARMSANVIRATINLPAIAVVTGLFPESYRAIVRPFLRGTVVRIGLFLGSGLILISDHLFHPRYLSLVAMPFVLVWAITPFVLKRRYAGILLDLLSEDKIDLRSLDADQMAQVFRNRQAQEGLAHRFENVTGDDRLWYGRLLRAIGFPHLEELLLKGLREEPEGRIRRELLQLLPDRVGPQAASVFNQLLETSPPDMTVAILDVSRRLPAEQCAALNRRVFELTAPLDIRARATGNLCALNPEPYAQIIEGWLASQAPDILKAGIIAAGATRDRRFSERLQQLLSSPPGDNDILLMALESLHDLDIRGLNDMVVQHLSSPDSRMRLAALKLYRIQGGTSLKRVIRMLGDSSPAVARLAHAKIRNGDFQDSMQLVKSLSLPSRRVRESLFELLSDMAIKDLDVFRFVESQVRSCFGLMLQSEAIAKRSGETFAQLLTVHLDERIWFTKQTIMRVLAAHDRSGRLKTIARGIFSKDKRRQANSMEAMDDIVDRSLIRLLAPLFDDLDPPSRIAAGMRLFPDIIQDPEEPELLNRLLAGPNWVTLVLTLAVIKEMGKEPDHVPRLKELVHHPNPHVAREATRLLQDRRYHESEPEEDAVQSASAMPLTEKILYLKKVEMFSDLSINEQAAVASITEELAADEGEVVFEEGAPGERLYLIIEGEVSVIKGWHSDNAFELDTIASGDYFGEFAMFADAPRSATIRVKKAARFLTLHRHEFQEMVREYPQIALHICRVLSSRIRRLHGKISDCRC